MRIFTIIAMVFLFVFVGMQRVAQGDEVKAKVEEMKGEANAKTENAKGEAKAFPQNTEPESHLGHGGRPPAQRPRYTDVGFLLTHAPPISPFSPLRRCL